MHKLRLPDDIMFGHKSIVCEINHIHGSADAHLRIIFIIYFLLKMFTHLFLE